MPEDKPKGLEEGPKIWIESLLSPQEWKECKKIHPKTYKLNGPPFFFKSDYEWRHKMGASLDAEKIRNIIGNIDYLLKKHELEVV